MSALEIIVLLIGVVVIVISFFISGNGNLRDENTEFLKREKEIKDFIDKEIQLTEAKIEQDLQESSTYLLEKSERTMDRFSNEKIMEITEYSDSVILQIQKNHDEVVFLYDMMNEKQVYLKKTAITLQDMAKEVDLTIDKTEERVDQIEKVVLGMEDKMSKVDEAVTLLKESTLEVVKVVHESKERLKENKNLVKTTKKSGNTVKKKEANNHVIDKKNVEESDFSTDNGNLIENNDLEEKSFLEDHNYLGEIGNVVGENSLTNIEKIMKSEDVTENMMKSSSRKQNKSIKTLPMQEIKSQLTNHKEEPEHVIGQNNNERILELHNRGKSNVLVAKELGIGVGEVKLVIDLFKGK